MCKSIHGWDLAYVIMEPRGSGAYVTLRGVLSFTERKKWQGVSTKGENGKPSQLEIYLRSMCNSGTG